MVKGEIFFISLTSLKQFH